MNVNEGHNYIFFLIETKGEIANLFFLFIIIFNSTK